ncbi:MAG: hypothetical protein N2C12_11340 [Planctomycetales bacterium]
MKCFTRSSVGKWTPMLPVVSSAIVLLALIFAGGRAWATDVDTADGRHFSNCSVLKADGLGIYFRHSNGIARVLYEDLSDKLLTALGPLPQDDVERAAQEIDQPQEVASREESSSIGALQLQFWQRVTYGVPESVTRARPCCLMQRGRFTGARRYSLFPCRQLAELDFLITTGILPRPAGVVTRRIPHRARYNNYY